MCFTFLANLCCGPKPTVDVEINDSCNCCVWNRKKRNKKVGDATIVTLKKAQTAAQLTFVKK